MILKSEIIYSQILVRLVKSIQADINKAVSQTVKELEPEYIQDSWVDNIRIVLEALAVKWESNKAKELFNKIALNFVRTSLNEVDKKLGFDVIQNTPEVKNILKAAALQNAELIQSIPEQYINRVASIVYSGMRTGLRHEAIAEQLQEQLGITERRAKFIARDQAGSINGELRKQRQLDAGFEYFRWLTSRDERVRSSHRKLEEQDVGYGKGIYKWTELPIDPDTGKPVQPAQPINCRCTAIPVLSSQVARNQNKP